MKISIITTITNPDDNQYPWREAIASYLALADEVIVVNGGKPLDYGRHYEKAEKGFDFRDAKEIMLPWPDKWHWSELPIHLNAGLKEATGDWVIKCDIDYVFHEDNIKDIKFALEKADNYAVASFVKKTIINREHYYKKCRIPVAINKGKMGDAIKFGIDPNEKSDWCMPILAKDKMLFDIDSMEVIKNKGEVKGVENVNSVPTGKLVPAGMVFDTGQNIYNYDCFFRTKEVQKREFWRFAQAYASAFDKSWGSTDEEAYKVWFDTMKARLERQLYPMSIESHPEFIKERVKNIKPEEFGFDNWGGMK